MTPLINQQTLERPSRKSNLCMSCSWVAASILYSHSCRAKSNFLRTELGLKLLKIIVILQYTLLPIVPNYNVFKFDYSGIYSMELQDHKIKTLNRYIAKCCLA